MSNNNVATISIASKFDVSSAKQAARKAGKSYDEFLKDIAKINLSDNLSSEFDKAMNLLKNKFKNVNLSRYTNNLLDSIISEKEISEKTKDFEKFVNKILTLEKALSGQNVNAFNSMSFQQIEAIISKTEKLSQKQEEITQKTREYKNEATKIAKITRKTETIDKNYGSKDYSKTLESLKKSLGTEKEFTTEQNQHIENLAKMINLYQVMEKVEPQKGTAEAIRYSKDLLAVTEKIREEQEMVDSFSSKGASAYISNNDLSSINNVNQYTVIKSKDDFVKSSLSSLKIQEAKIQSELSNYISNSVKKNLEKTAKEAETVIDKAEKKAEGLQNRIDDLKGNTNKGAISNNSVANNIVSDSDIKSLEEIENKLYSISDAYEDGDVSNKQLKEYIQLYKEYKRLKENDSLEFDPSLKETYDSLLYDENLKKYADELDKVIEKKKELTTGESSVPSQQNIDSDTEQLSKQEQQIRETNQAGETLADTKKKLDNNTKIIIDAEAAIESINKVKEGIENLPDEKKIKISVNSNDYSSIEPITNEAGKLVDGFRGVKNAWSGLVNDKGIGFFTDSLKLAVDYADELASDGKVYRANLSFKNPLEIDGKGAIWNEIEFEGVKRTTDEIVEIAKNLGGYDGVIFKNIRDGFTDTEGDLSNVLVVFDEAQIKNAEVIGSVKASTGELVAVNNSVKNVADLTVDSQNQIQQELKETEQIAEQTAEALEKVNSNGNKSNILSGNTSPTQIVNESKKTAEEIKRLDFTPNTEGFKDIIDKFNILKEQAEQISKITKTTLNDGTVSYNAKLKNGTSYYLGENSSPQVLKANEIVYDAKSAEQETKALNSAYEEATKINNALNETASIIKNLPVPKSLREEFEYLSTQITELQTKLKNSEISVPSYNKSVNSLVSSYSKEESKTQSSVNSALKQQESAWKNIQSIREKIAKANPENKEYITQLQNTKIEYQKQYIEAGKILKTNQDLYDSELQISKLKQIELETTAKITKYNSDKSSTKLNNIETQISSFTSSLQKLSFLPDADHSFASWTNKLTEIKTKINELKTLKDNARIVQGIVNEEDLNKINTLSQEIKTLITEAGKTPQLERGWKDINATNVAEKIWSILEQNTKMSAEARAKIRAYYDEIRSGKPSAPLNEILDTCIKISQEERNMGRAGKSFFDIFKTKATYGFIGQMQSYLSMYFGFYGIIRYIKSAITTIKELDTALVDLKKTTAMTSSQLEDFYYDSNDVAKQMGVTTQEIIEQASAWSRLNKIGLLYGDI